MNRILCCILILAASAFAQQPAPTRPKITGIDHVDFYTTNPDGNRHLYAIVLGLQTAAAVEPGQTQRYMVGTQWVGYSPAPDPKATDRMDHVAFRTDDCEALRKYLAAKGVKVPDSSTSKNGTSSFRMKDPEGHDIEFVQLDSGAPMSAQTHAGDAVSRRIIHAGFLVYDRPAE